MILNEALSVMRDQDTAAKRLEFAKSCLWGAVVDAMADAVLAARQSKAGIARLKRRIDELEAREIPDLPAEPTWDSRTEQDGGE